MSDINLSRLPGTLGKEEFPPKTLTPLQEVNEALKVCTFGCFHIRLVVTAIIGMIAGGMTTNTTAYLLSNAECDLHMNLNQKGLLTSMPYFGMLVTSILGGFLSDTFGRKIFILVGFGGKFIFNVLSGLSQTFVMLATTKVCEGLFFGMATKFALTSEFLHNDVRDRVMLVQASSSGAAQILTALIAWGILTNNWNFIFFNGYFVLKTWNIYLLVMALWSLTAFILYLMIPESPKYLVSQGRYAEARSVLMSIYKTNTGKSDDSCPFANIWKNKATEPNNKDTKKSLKYILAYQVVIGLRQAKFLFKKPLSFHLLVICAIMFCSVMLFNIIRLWYPQLSTIMEHYNEYDGNPDLCTVLDDYTVNQQVNPNNVTADCIPKTSGTETYINSIILGCTGYLPYLLSGILVNKVGKKILVFLASILNAAATIGLRFSTSKAMVVTLFSLNSAISQTANGLYQTIAVECFPTSTRSLALSIIMTCGRLATMVGSIMFPVLLNMGCVIPFYTLAGMMFGVMVLTLFLPSKK